MAIYYESYVQDQINEYINGRETVKSLCDFTILNFNWNVTAVIMDTRVGFFFFEETSPGLIRIQDYAELGLQDIQKVEKENASGTFKCSIHTRDGKLVMESQHLEDAGQFIDLLAKVSENASGFQRWISDFDKHGLDLSSFIYWSTTGRVNPDPGKVTSRQNMMKYIGFGGLALFIIGLTFEVGIFTIIGIVAGIFGVYLYTKGSKMKCPACKKFNALKDIDTRYVSETPTHQIHNVYRFCQNCGIKVIGSKEVKKG